MADSSVNVAPFGSTPIGTDQRTTNAGAVQIQQTVIFKGEPNTSGPLVSLAIASLALATITSSVPVTNTKVGSLQHAVFASTQPTLWRVQTVNASLATVQFNLTTNANETFDYKPGLEKECSTVVASGGNTKFQVQAQNLSTNELNTANAYVTFWWGEG
jgi:hypothetical protein